MPARGVVIRGEPHVQAAFAATIKRMTGRGDNGLGVERVSRLDAHRREVSEISWATLDNARGNVYI
jgi:hypothetical protein